MICIRFAIGAAMASLLIALVSAQGSSIPESDADGIPGAIVPASRKTMLNFLRQDPEGLGNLNVSTFLIRINDGNEGAPGSDSDLGSSTFRGTFFVPSDSAWEQFVRTIYGSTPVPDLSTPNAIANAVIDKFNDIRTRFQDVETLYRTVRYHITPGSAYYSTNVTDNVISTLSGYNLTVDDEGTLYDFMNESVPITGSKYLLNNGWIIPIEKVLIPFNITELLARVEPSPSGAVSPSVTPSPSSQSPDSSGPSVPPSPSTSTSIDGPDVPTPSGSSSVEAEPIESPDMDPSGGGDETQGTPDGNGDGTGDGNGDGDDGDDGVCFPASSRVHLSGGLKVAMKDLEAGMPVLHAEDGHSSSVFLFTHRDGRKWATFKKLSTACGQTLTLTQNHYLYVNGKLTAAGAVTVGDNLRTVSGPCAVTEVATTKEIGLFAPHTLHGDLIVEGVVVSGYSRAVHPDVAHALLAPVRWFSTISGVKEPLGSTFYNGANWALKVMPRGKDRYL